MNEIERLQVSVVEQYGPSVFLRLMGDRVLIAQETDDGYKPHWRGTIDELYAAHLRDAEPDEVTAAKLRLHALLMKTEGLSAEDLELGLQLASDLSVRHYLNQQETPR